MSNPRYNKWKNSKRDKFKRELGFDPTKKRKRWKKHYEDAGDNTTDCPDLCDASFSLDY